jgi:trimeric autotransporter adhesin
VDGNGNLFVVDYTRVRRVSPNGTVTTVAGGTGIIGDIGDGGAATSAGFIGPTAVALDRVGNLYIGDVSRVRKVSPDGIINTVAGGGKSDPGDGGPATSAQIAVEGIALDVNGNLYIAGYGRVRKVSPGGTITTVAGNGH